MVRLRRRVPSRLEGERGSVAAEMAVLAPLLILVLIACVQFGQWYLARNGVHAAAVVGAQAARADQSTPGAGESAAGAYLAGLGGAVVAPSVRVSSTAADVTVTVTGQAPLILAVPGLSFTVEQSATAPLERWVTP